MKKVICLVILTVIVVGVVSVVSAAERQEPIYFFDMTYLHELKLDSRSAREEIYDHSLLVTSLQGLVNRDAPRLYISYVKERSGARRNVDEFWFDKLRAELGWLADSDVVRVSSIEELLGIFKDYYNGTVVWDPKVPATVNAACTVAGVEDLVVLRFDPNPDSLYGKLVSSGKIKVEKWLVQENGESLFTGTGMIPGTDIPSTGSSKVDVYMWAKEHYLDTGKANPNKMGYYLDAYVLNFNWGANWASSIVNRDYFISHRAFFFDLLPVNDETPVDDRNQMLGLDFHMLTEILRSSYFQDKESMIHIGGFVPWPWKYTNFGSSGGQKDPVPVEWLYAKVISAFNGYMDADAIDSSGIGIMANASFYAHYPLDDVYPQNPKPTVEDLQARGYVDENGKVIPKRYMAFYVGDWDSAAWVYQCMPELWHDATRGRVPLNWAINPNLQERVGPIMAYLRKTMTNNDFFVAGDSGAGYINPGMLQEPREYSSFPSGVELWKEHNIPYFQRWDLSVTGFIIDGYAPAMSKEVLDAYALFSPDGIVAQKIPEHGVHNGMPYIRMNLDIDGQPKEAAQAIARYMNLSPGILGLFGTGVPEKPHFYVFRAILKHPRWYVGVCNELERRYAKAQVEVVDMYTLMKLIELYHNG